MNKPLLFLIIFLANCLQVSGQVSHPSSQLKHRIDKLSKLGTVLYFAAHPDDENTRLIAWLSGEQHYRTAYLSLTRGDGGQNLIGTEQGIELGLIRTQELLAARKIDKGEQYFSAAYDFGFSKTHQETFKFWQKEEILKEAVFIIRKLQPDVIITRFPPDSRGGHGHHQASAILAQEAFIAAGDPTRFPEQLDDLQPWKAKRLVWNTANFGGMDNTSDDQLQVVLDDYNPLLGVSYGEIAARSRSEHKSQGFGAALTRGRFKEYFQHVAGIEARDSLFDHINTTWSRLPEPTQAVETMINTIKQTYDMERPARSIPALIELHALISELSPHIVYRENKLKEVENLILDCAGIVLESVVTEPNYTLGQSFTVTHKAILRDSTVQSVIKSVNDQEIGRKLQAHQPESITQTETIFKTTQPYWLKKEHSLGKYQVESEQFGLPENPDNPSSLFEIQINELVIRVERPILFQYVHPVKGEVNQPLSISPRLTAKLSAHKALLTDDSPKAIDIEITNHSPDSEAVELSFAKNSAIKVEQSDSVLTIPALSSRSLRFNILSTSSNTSETTRLTPLLNGQPAQGFQKISHAHIPDITWFPPATLDIAEVAITVPIKKVGYIHGAGDLIPTSLRNIGIVVEELPSAHLRNLDLGNYDAIILGVRALNVLPEMRQGFPILLDYVKSGGTLVVQYNVNSGLQIDQLGPHPITLSRERVTEEDAKVVFTDPKDPILNFPNKVSARDFDGWVQERGLYFASDMHPAYRTPLAMADENERPHNGSLLVADYGKGKFVYTSLSFFRQLPAGIPGAYRLFVNLLSKNEEN